MQTALKWWMQKPWRMIQMNMREIDMADIRADQVVADLESFQANVVMLNTSGIIASYPTSLPYHFQSPYLQGDSLRTIIDACHAAGIKVIGRMDFSKVRRPIYENNRDWAFVSAKGEIIDYHGDVHVCFNSEYQQNLSLEIVSETVEKLGIDGVFFNMEGYSMNFDYSGNYYGICQCQACGRRYQEMYGQSLPKVEDVQDPNYRQYREFQRITVGMHRQRVYRILSEKWPDLCIANHPEVGQGYYRTESNDSLSSQYGAWHYDATYLNKMVRGTYPDMQPSIATVDFIDIAYRHVAVSPHQQRLRLLQNLAQGGSLDFYMISRIDNHADRSGFKAVREVFHYHAAHEEAYVQLESTARVVLLQNATVGMGRAMQPEFRGWVQLLSQQHILFDIVGLDRIGQLNFARYDTVIMPDYEKIDAELAHAIDRFVENGGTLIATHRSGLNVVSNAPIIPVLQCLGIQAVRGIEEYLRPAYLQKSESEIAHYRHSVDSDLIYAQGGYVYADYDRSVEKRMKLIPPHLFGPPERCYYTEITEEPGYTLHAYGKGKVLYMPWSPGATFYQGGHTNTVWFVADLLENVLDITAVQGNLPPAVEIQVMSRNGGEAWLLHVVNGSGHMGRTYYEPCVFHDLYVELPCATEPREVSSLRRDGPADWKWQEDRLRISFHCLEAFEAIEIRF